MGSLRKLCIWFGQCGSDCSVRCSDFSPADELEKSESDYHAILKENVEEYQRVIREYSDGGELQ